jgi:hypothetical protein
VVGREVAVQGVGQDAEVAVEEEDDDQGEEGGRGGLHYCADLGGQRVSLVPLFDGLGRREDVQFVASW